MASQIKVMMINPNPRTMSLIQPTVALFYSILKEHGIEMRFFDTTFYDTSEFYADTEKYTEITLGVPRLKEVKPKELASKKTMVHLLQDFREELESFYPDVLLVSATESTIVFARDMLRTVRDLKIPHVLGGVFATSVPELAISYDEFGVICVGEAENVLVPLVQRLANGDKVSGLPGLWQKNKDGSIERTGIASPVNINNNPRFDASIFEDSRFYRPMAGRTYRMFPVESHRGCTLKCTFCNSPVQNAMYKKVNARYFRMKSVQKVIEDIRYFVEEMNAEYLFFWADNFLTYSNDEIDEFCEAYADFKVPFFIQSYPITLKDYKIKKLAEVGLHRVVMGVEHGNAEFRRKVVHRIYSNEEAIKQVGILRKYGIQYSANNIVGFPKETPELHMDTVRLNRAMMPDTASCAIFTPFHGTYLRRMCIDLGYLDNPDILAPANSEDSILNMPQFTKKQIFGKARTFNLYLKFPESRWKDIEKAEATTPEGNQIWAELRQEYMEKYDSVTAVGVH